MPAGRLDAVIHQQTRLSIMAALHRNGRLTFADLRDGLGLTAGNVATHTAKLEAAGYVRRERRFTPAGFEAHFVLTPRGGEAFLAYLADVRAMLAEAGLDGFPEKQP